MNKMTLLLLSTLSVISGTAAADPAAFESLVCQSVDYHNLGGNRKVLEISAIKESGGTYRVGAVEIFEVRMPDRTYQEESRKALLDFAGLTCVQAAPGIDTNVIACSTPGPRQYFGLSRLEQTVIMSAFASTPEKIIKTTSYEGMAFGGGKSIGSPRFRPEECILK